jgi:hypothetical protein
MTTTDPAGIGRTLADRLAAVHKPQEVACDEADLSRTTYYRRLGNPSGWTLGELERMADAAGLVLRVELAPRTGTPSAMRPETLDPASG